MADYSNPKETERIWLEALEREMQTYQSNVSRACSPQRAVTSQEIHGLIDYAQRVLQYFAQYSPVAHELARLGLPRLRERLDFVQRDLGEALQIYGDMLRTTAQHEAYRAQIQREVSTNWTNTIRESTLHSQKVFDQCTQMRNYANHGMSFGMAEFLAKLPK